MQNTVHVTYELISGADRVELALRPSVNFRAQELPVSDPLGGNYEFRAVRDLYEICLPGSPLPPLRFRLWAPDVTFILKGRRIDNVLYPVEESRGYQARGDLWSPGYFRFVVTNRERATLVASTESPETMHVLEPQRALEAERGRRRRLVMHAAPEAREGVPAELALAADQFIFTPAGRSEETARAHAYGDEVRSVIAGYHWFTDWGRDTFVALRGLCLETGRLDEAKRILLSWCDALSEGMMPNMFPVGRTEPRYNSVDASLWFIIAAQAFLDASARRGRWLEPAVPKRLTDAAQEILESYARGTRYGIHMDSDALLAAGEPGMALTWMDAIVDGVPVTPRIGKPVEIQALWVNALVIGSRWTERWGDLAEAASESFVERFWNARRSCLFDVVDVEHAPGRTDDRLRPNQIMAVGGLRIALLAGERARSVVDVVERELWTPLGLRTLARDDPEYATACVGPPIARDRAYHNGPAWPWLMGPFVDAWVRSR
jgi:predicted glycogen debranching enzyme